MSLSREFLTNPDRKITVTDIICDGFVELLQAIYGNDLSFGGDYVVSSPSFWIVDVISKPNTNWHHIGIHDHTIFCRCQIYPEFIHIVKSDFTPEIRIFEIEHPQAFQHAVAAVFQTIDKHICTIKKRFTNLRDFGQRYKLLLAYRARFNRKYDEVRRCDVSS